MLRQLWTILQWMKTSKSYKSWFASFRDAYARILRRFSWRRFIRSRARVRPTILPSVETLECRVVPTISIGGTTYSTLAGSRRRRQFGRYHKHRYYRNAFWGLCRRCDHQHVAVDLRVGKHAHYLCSHHKPQQQQ